MNWSLHDRKGDRILALTDDQPSVLELADELVNGDRQESYGHPASDFACTAALWSAWLSRKYGTVLSLEAEDVGWLMTLLKISREAHTSTPDNLVDAVGYLTTVDLVRRHRPSRVVGVPDR